MTTHHQLANASLTFHYSLPTHQESNEVKWNLKKKALDDLLAMCGNPPKLKVDTDLLELCSKLKPLILHSHQQVSTTALRCMARIGKGLRGKFNQCCHDTVQFKIMCSRLKDKKLVRVGRVGLAFNMRHPLSPRTFKARLKH